MSDRVPKYVPVQLSERLYQGEIVEGLIIQCFAVGTPWAYFYVGDEYPLAIHRTKIAVHSSDMKVDPIGACVGVRGTRIRNIVEELNGEKIDDCTKWWGEDRHIVIYYVKPDRSEVYLVTSQPEPDFRIESWSTKGDVRDLRASFRGFHPEVEHVLAACPDVHKWAIVDRNSLARWADRNVTLLGANTYSGGTFIGANELVLGDGQFGLRARLIRTRSELILRQRAHRQSRVPVSEGAAFQRFR